MAKDSKPEWAKKFHGDVSRYGCIACRIQASNFADDDSFGVAQVHHIREGGLTRHAAVIPLCKGHHTGEVGSDKAAIHAGKKTFRQQFGHEWVLYIELREILSGLGKWPYQAENWLQGHVDGGWSPILAEAMRAEE